MSRGISGKLSKVMVGSCTVAEFTDWQATLDKGLKLYNAYAGSGWQRTVVGNKKVSGRIGGKYDSSDPIDVVLNTDSLVALKLNFDSSPNEYMYGQARIGQVEFNCNSDTGDIETWSAPFESDGAWVFS